MIRDWKLGNKRQEEWKERKRKGSCCVGLYVDVSDGAEETRYQRVRVTMVLYTFPSCSAKQQDHQSSIANKPNPGIITLTKIRFVLCHSCRRAEFPCPHGQAGRTTYNFPGLTQSLLQKLTASYTDLEQAEAHVAW